MVIRGWPTAVTKKKIVLKVGRQLLLEIVVGDRKRQLSKKR